MTTATDLKTGQLLHAQGVNWLPIVDVYLPTEPGDYVEVDVTSNAWDTGVLVYATSAVDGYWRYASPDGPYYGVYRLFFRADAQVETRDAAEAATR